MMSFPARTPIANLTLHTRRASSPGGANLVLTPQGLNTDQGISNNACSHPTRKCENEWILIDFDNKPRTREIIFQFVGE